MQQIIYGILKKAVQKDIHPASVISNPNLTQILQDSSFLII